MENEYFDHRTYGFVMRLTLLLFTYVMFTLKYVLDKSTFANKSLVDILLFPS